MIVKGVDLGLNLQLVAKVKPLKNEVQILDKSSKIQKTIYGFPTIKSTFRTYEFNFLDKEKLKKAVETSLKLDLPFNIEEITYDYVVKIQKDKALVFCVIAKKEDIQNLQEADILDSEVFSILRIAKFLKIENANIIHFSDGYVLDLIMEDSFIKQVRVLKSIESISENAFLSGKIPENFENHKKLKIKDLPTEYNVAYGLILRTLDDTGIDLLHKSSKDVFVSLLKGAFYLFLSIIILSFALGFKIYILNKQVEYIKEKQKELFVKSFNYTGSIFDPLEQAKSKLLMVKTKNTYTEDTIDVLNFIGKAINTTKDIKIFKITISNTRFTLKGQTKSIGKIEKFKNFLNRKYNVKIEETVNTPKGEVRFTISGEIS